MQFEEYVFNEGNCSGLTEKQMSFQQQISVKGKENTPVNNEVITSIKHVEGVVPLHNVKQWKRSKKVEQKEKTPVQKEQLLNIAPSMKYAQSAYELCEYLLHFDYQGMTITLDKTGSIGRSIGNQVNINQNSVSREHAIVKRIANQYYLQDIGSRFHTYIEVGIDFKRPLENGDFLAFDDHYIEIVSSKIYNQKGEPCFDMKVNIFKSTKAEEKSFFALKHISIGKNEGNNIIFNSSTITPYHSRISIHNRRLYIVKEQGECFLKLNRQELHLLQQQQLVRFGLQKVRLWVQRKSRPMQVDNWLDCQK